MMRPLPRCNMPGRYACASRVTAPTFSSIISSSRASGCLGEQSVVAEARVVDEHVDLGHFGNELAGAGRIGEIDGHHASAAQLGGKGFELVGTPGGQHDVVVGGQDAGDFEADTTRRAGNQGCCHGDHRVAAHSVRSTLERIDRGRSLCRSRTT